MGQEAITEIDMDVFSRRIGPYFSWIESRIESGWQQSDSVEKDILKEVKYLATTMRARFILGVSKEDFSKEVQRTLELFELASEAFPSENDEIESKVKHFCKGVSEELGSQFLPNEYQVHVPRPPQPPEPHPMPGPGPLPGPEPEPGPDHPEPFEPDEEKSIKVEPVKTRIKKVETKKLVQEVKKAQEVEIKRQRVVEVKKAVKKPAKKAKPKGFFLVRWAKKLIYGD